jgi:hypothetical protein
MSDDYKSSDVGVGWSATNTRAVPRHNSLENHAERLEQERNAVTNTSNAAYKEPARSVMFVEDVDKLLDAQSAYMQARVNYILSKYIGPTHKSYVEVQKFFSNKP